MHIIGTCAVLYVVPFIYRLMTELFLPRMVPWDELEKQYPHLKSIRHQGERNVNRSFLLVMLGLLIAFILISISAKYHNESYALILLAASILEVTQTREALVQGVFSIPIGRVSSKYYYDENGKYRWIAKLHLILASLVSLTMAWIIVRYFYQYFFA